MIIVLLGNANPTEGTKPYKDIQPSDPDLLEKASVLKTMKDGVVTYDPQNEENPDREMVASRLREYTVSTPIAGGAGNAVTGCQLAANDAFSAWDELKPIVKYHFAEGKFPTWVESNDPALEKLLADRWGCKIRRPEGHDDPRPIADGEPYIDAEVVSDSDDELPQIEAPTTKPKGHRR